MLRLRKAGMFGLLVGMLAVTGCTTPDRISEGPVTSHDWPPTNSAPQTPGVTPRGQIPDVPPAPPMLQKPSIPAPPTTPALDLATYRVRICAWVNGKPLFEGELFNFAIGELAATQSLVEPERSVKRKEVLKNALKRLIDKEVVYQDAIKKLEKTPQYLDKLKDGAKKEFNKYVWKHRQALKVDEVEYKKRLEQQGTSLEDQYRQLEREFIVGEYMRSRVIPRTDKIGHQEIVDYWNAHQNEFQSTDRVEWEDIFILVGSKQVPTLEYARTLADWVAKQLVAGTPIEQLLKYDDGDSSTRKGRGNGERHGDIRPPELEKTLFDMKPGQVAQPLEMATGIHVFRLAKREYAHQLPFTAEVQSKIRTKLKNEIYTREFDLIIRQLASHTVIEVDPDVFK